VLSRAAHRDEKVTLENEPELLAMAECTRSEKRWWRLRETTVRIQKQDKFFKHPRTFPSRRSAWGSKNRRL
jgi:hypothetical protein